MTLRRLGALLVLAVFLASACTIKTKSEAEEEDLEEATAIETESTLPPEEGVGEASSLRQTNVTLATGSQFTVPLTMIASRSGSESIYLGDPHGRIYRIERDAKRNLEAGFTTYTWRPQTSPWLDISRQVRHIEDDPGGSPDQGLYGFDFSTDGSRLYVSFTNNEGNMQVDEFRIGASGVSTSSQRELLQISQTHPANNGGPVMVGSDGFLHIALGDGGEGPDYAALAQDPLDWRGSILRIDPEAGVNSVYTIPFGNPYNGDNGAREVYLTGVRHPSSMAYDPITRSTYIADRGADGLQEITVIAWDGNEPAVTANLGWPLYNGSQPTGPVPDPLPEHLLPPILEYPPTGGNCGIVGGTVYRGSSIPNLQGAYIYGDFCTGDLFAILVEDGALSDGVKLPIEIEPQTLGAIGTDPSGELLITTTTGSVFQVHFVPPEVDPAAA